MYLTLSRMLRMSSTVVTLVRFLGVPMGGCEYPWDGCVHARRQAVNARFGNDSMYSFEFMTRVSVCTIYTAQVAVVTP